MGGPWRRPKFWDVGLLALVAVLAVTGLLALRFRGRILTAAFVVVLVASFALDLVEWSPPLVASSTPIREASQAQVLSLVRASNTLTSVPADIDVTPEVDVTEPLSDWGGTTGTECFPGITTSTVGPCVFGDTQATRTVVLYGDSHVQMWFQAVNAVAKRDAWKLVILSKGACPAASFVGRNGRAVETAAGSAACRAWHHYAIARINRLRPDLLIVSQSSYERADGSQYTTTQWRLTLAGTLRQLHARRTVVLGDIPLANGPECLLTKTVAACSKPRDASLSPFLAAERNAAQSTGAGYLDVTPWFCATKCSPVIGRYDVYTDSDHLALGYSEYLEGVLRQGLGI